MPATPGAPQHPDSVRRRVISIYSRLKDPATNAILTPASAEAHATKLIENWKGCPEQLILSIEHKYPVAAGCESGVSREPSLDIATPPFYVPATLRLSMERNPCPSREPYLGEFTPEQEKELETNPFLIRPLVTASGQPYIDPTKEFYRRYGDTPTTTKGCTDAMLEYLE